MSVPPPTLTPITLRAGCNEASDLLPVSSRELCAAHGWRRAFWTVLDEAPVEQALALVGLADTEPDAGEWQAIHVAADAGAQTGRTEDAEALAYRDGWVYVVGSHFGSKRGLLRPKRAFVARFREAAAVTGRVRLEVARAPFRLHRAVNDALAAAGVAVLPPGPAIRDRYLRATLARGHERGKRWVRHLVETDTPINVEAAAFTPAGTLLLGLRYPVTVAGAPILVEVANVDALFDGDDAMPDVVAVRTVPGVTDDETPVGFRALSARPDGQYDAIVGSLDATGKNSTVLADHPRGADAHCRHVRLSVPPAGDPAPVAAELVRDLVGVDNTAMDNVEGVAEVDGRAHYVTDEDHHIRLWL